MHGLHLALAARMRHRAAEIIRLSIGETGERMSNGQNLLLEEQDTFAVSQDEAKDRMSCPEIVSGWAMPGGLDGFVLSICLLVVLMLPVLSRAYLMVLMTLAVLASCDIGMDHVGLDGAGTTSFGLAFEVRTGDQVVATGRTVYVVVATDGSGKRPIPAPVRATLGIVTAST